MHKYEKICHLNLNSKDIIYHYFDVKMMSLMTF